MKDGRDCNETFADGIVNGAYWYELSGGMQDFNYVFSNCFELTLELSCCKFPPASELPNEWRKNKRSMLEYLKQTHIGVKVSSYIEEISVQCFYTMLLHLCRVWFKMSMDIQSVEQKFWYKAWNRSQSELLKEENIGGCWNQAPTMSRSSLSGECTFLRNLQFLSKFLSFRLCEKKNKFI